MQGAHVVSILKRAVVAGEGSSKLGCSIRFPSSYFFDMLFVTGESFRT
jgi:hypothetical protein